MSIKPIFSALSLSASVDQQTGHMSVFDVVDEVRLPQVPFHLPSLIISLIVEKTISMTLTGKMMIHILTPDGKQNLLGSGDLEIPSEQKRMKAVFRFGGFPIFHFGAHRIVISWLNSSNAKIGEAILDFEALQAAQPIQNDPTPPSGKPPITH